ncbi:proteoglycan 4 isoform X2 [Drosophila hydei]|uniref:Proteoglycan 4 isoform X2 n=1 Tax=Drosophila hydei TaxID=7224 RepID=A0A6J2SUR2_DROHY|nr:proteoglycan 4 isoform X2 [Drosophila hydei]
MVKAGHIILLTQLLVIAGGVDLRKGDDYVDNEVSPAELALSFPRVSRKSAAYDGNIEKIDVKCDTSNGMIVEVEFAEIFNGVIYSQGYYNDPKCKYVSAGSNERRFVFKVPFNGCGSKPSCSICASVDNILIIQNDQDIQESWDTARKITCSRSDEQEKTVYFRPFVVDMLEVISVETPSGPVECWMEIGTGLPPNIKPINYTLKLGTDITFTINVKQSKQTWDINILQCYASDDPSFDTATTNKLQLSDKNGCSLKTKVFGQWKKLESIPGQTLTYYNTLKAFKFPDRSQVYLKCDIELCNGACERNFACGEELIDPIKPHCSLGSTDPACQAGTTRPPKKPRCYPGSTDPRCPDEPKTTASSNCYPGSLDPRCPQEAKTTSKPQCTPGSTDPDCQPATYLPPPTRRPPVTPTKPRCYPGSTDPRCPQEPKATAAPNCYPGSRDPRCPQEPITTQKPRCPPGSTDPDCQPATYLPPTTRRPPVTSTKPRCYPGSKDPRCPQEPKTTARPKCYPGSTDPRCPQEPKTTAAPNCYPGSRDPRCPQEPATTSKPRCYPGSTDPDCQPATYLPPTTRRPPVTPTKPRCYPGSTDPRCPQEPKTTARPKCYPGSTDPRCPQEPKTTAAPNCYPGSRDPRCPQEPITTQKPRCLPGSSDPDCQPATYLPPTTRRPPVTSTKPRCYPGSSDPRCPKEPVTTAPTPSCYPGSKEPECLNCFPGSPDPRCPKVPTTKKPGCYEGSTDPKCQPATYLPPIKTTKIPGNQITPAKPVCRPGSTDPRCPQEPKTTARPNCYPGSTDPRCPQEPKTTTTPNCYPGSRDPRCPQEPATTSKPRCYPGSTDPDCQPATYLPPTTRRPPVTPTKPRCYPGSTDPRCPQEPKTTAAPNCYPGSRDPRCPQKPITTQKPRCLPGSTDPDCQPATYLPPTSGRPRVTTTAKPNCYPGSTDISCPHSLVTSTSPPDTTPVYCYPGSVDPRCPDTYKGSTPIPATYLPPLSNPGYDRTVRDAKSKFFNEINKLAITNNNVFELDDDEDAEPARIKRDLSDLNINPLTSTDQSDDLLSRKIMKREFNERQPEREVISFTLGIRTAINVN